MQWSVTRIQFLIYSTWGGVGWNCPIKQWNTDKTCEVREKSATRPAALTHRQGVCCSEWPWSFHAAAQSWGPCAFSFEVSFLTLWKENISIIGNLEFLFFFFFFFNFSLLWLAIHIFLKGKNSVIFVTTWHLPYVIKFFHICIFIHYVYTHNE